MKNILNNLVNGRDNKLNGLIALAVVLSIALGCNCNRSLDLGNTSSNSPTDNPFGNSSTTGDDSDGVPGDEFVNKK